MSESVEHNQRGYPYATSRFSWGQYVHGILAALSLRPWADGHSNVTFFRQRARRGRPDSRTHHARSYSADRWHCDWLSNVLEWAHFGRTQSTEYAHQSNMVVHLRCAHAPAMARGTTCARARFVSEI